MSEKRILTKTIDLHPILNPDPIRKVSTSGLMSCFYFDNNTGQEIQIKVTNMSNETLLIGDWEFQHRLNHADDCTITFLDGIKKLIMIYPVNPNVVADNSFVIHYQNMNCEKVIYIQSDFDARILP